ncbi:hypothetical protein [Klebsiella pneumoniae]
MVPVPDLLTPLNGTMLPSEIIEVA